MPARLAQLATPVLVAPLLIIKEHELKEEMGIMDEVLDYVDTLVK
jgi:hypothetical protein